MDYSCSTPLERASRDVETILRSWHISDGSDLRIFLRRSKYNSAAASWRSSHNDTPQKKKISRSHSMPDFMASSPFRSSSSKSSFGNRKHNTKNNHHYNNIRNYHSIRGISVYFSFDQRILVLAMSYFPIIIRPEIKRQPKQKRFQLDLIISLWDCPLNNTGLLLQHPESTSSSLPPPLSLICN